MVNIKPPAQLLNYLKASLALSSLCALISWPLYGVIALRNISLAFGGILALAIFVLQIKTRQSIKFTRINTAFWILLLLLGWVLFRFWAFSDFPELEKGELTSLWMRSLLATLLGATLGTLLAKESKYKPIILTAICIVIFAEYYLGLFSKSELLHQPYDGFYKSKAAVSYFLLLPYLIGCGYFYFALSAFNHYSLRIFSFMGLSILAVGLSMFAFYFSKSLNGLLVAGICTIPLMLKILTDILKQKEKIGLRATIIVVLISSILGFINLHSKYDSKLNNIINDAYFGTQIDLYPNWQNNSGASWVPIVPGIHEVNQSTYYRTANMLNGMRFIKDYPLGLGFTNLPYGYLMKQKYPLSQATHTHSGWVDFALGQGIPGLLLLWLAMLSTFILGLRSVRISSINDSENRLWGYVTMWLMGGMFIAWIFNEVSEREYIEQLFFIISLFAASNAPYKPLAIKAI